MRFQFSRTSIKEEKNSAPKSTLGDAKLGIFERILCNFLKLITSFSVQLLVGRLSLLHLYASLLGTTAYSSSEHIESLKLLFDEFGSELAGEAKLSSDIWLSS